MNDEPPCPPEVRAPLGERVGRWVLPAGALLCLAPGVTAIHGLVLGVAVALILGHPWGEQTRRWTPRLLQASIVGLGFGMDLHGVVEAGLQGLGITFLGLLGVLGVGVLLGRVLGVARNVCLLVTVGTAICGGSAIAAVVPVLKAKDSDVSVALGVVFVLNAVGLLLFPALGHAMGLTPSAFGLWAALAIHDTSSVVGAASAYHADAIAIATSVKLARALWIVPLTFALGAWLRWANPDGVWPRPKPRRPWFLLAFLGAAALATFVPGAAPWGAQLAGAARQLLVLTLFLVGAGLTPEALRAVGVRPLVHGVLLWAVSGTLSLVLVTSWLAP